MSKFFFCVCVCVGQITEGEEKALREEKGTRETIKLENCFVVNVFHMLATCQFDSVLLFLILFCIKCIKSLCKPLGDERFNWFILRHKRITRAAYIIPTGRTRIRSVSLDCLVY